MLMRENATERVLLCDLRASGREGGNALGWRGEVSKYEVLHQALSRGLLKIADMISAEYKLTLVCRHPTNPKAHIIIGDDEDRAAVAQGL